MLLPTSRPSCHKPCPYRCHFACCCAVAEAVLGISRFNVPNRVDAFRLLARCRAATGQQQAACAALEMAAEEAHRAGYEWLQLLALCAICSSARTRSWLCASVWRHVPWGWGFQAREVTITTSIWRASH